MFCLHWLGLNLHVCPQHGPCSHLWHQTALRRHFSTHRVPKIPVSQNVVLWKEFWRNAFFLANENFSKVWTMWVFEFLGRTGTLVLSAGGRNGTDALFEWSLSRSAPILHNWDSRSDFFQSWRDRSWTLCLVLHGSWLLRISLSCGHYACRKEAMNKGKSLHMTSILVS